MGKKKNKNKTKKVSAKKERYSKFRKEKPTNLTMAPPELSDDVVQQRRVDEQRINDFWRHFRRAPERYVLDRKAKSKR